MKTMSAPHPDLLKTLPNEAELIEAEALVLRLESRNEQPLTQGLTGNEIDYAVNKWRRRANALSTLRRLIEFASKHQ
jgi:hypothetical protein